MYILSNGMFVVRHLGTSKHFVVYFDGSVITVYSSNKLYFYFVAASVHLYVDYIEEE